MEWHRRWEITSVTKNEETADESRDAFKSQSKVFLSRKRRTPFKRDTKKEIVVWFEVQKIFNCLTDARHNFHFLKIGSVHVCECVKQTAQIGICVLKIWNNVSIVISISTSWFLQKWHEMLFQRERKRENHPKIGCWWYTSVRCIQIYFMSVPTVSACIHIEQCVCARVCVFECEYNFG